ncbi:MAG: hypothetical protein EHM42_10710 [Planctomycetaceae bacterium]|nr:MAG: hypothetical protein EHM42_10710 [Planctomycetaceae bacterium]
MTLQLDTDTTVTGNDVVIWTGVAVATESVTFRVTVSANDSGDLVVAEVSGQNATPISGVGSEVRSTTATTADALGTAGLDVFTGDVVIVSHRSANANNASLTIPSGATAITTDASFRGGVYYKEFGSDSAAEKMRFTTPLARTCESGGIVVATASAPGGVLYSQIESRHRGLNRGVA